MNNQFDNDNDQSTDGDKSQTLKEIDQSQGEILDNSAPVTSAAAAPADAITKPSHKPFDLSKSPKRLKNNILTYALVVLTAVIGALGVYIFILPNRFAPGGLTGIAAAVYYINPNINPGILILVLNIPLLVAAFFFLKRDYVIKTVVSLLISSGLLTLLQSVNWEFIESIRYATPNLILPAVAGGVVRGLGMGIMMKIGSSNGGSEIVGGLVNFRWPNLNVAKIILAVDVAVILGTAFTASGTPIPVGEVCIAVDCAICNATECVNIISGNCSGGLDCLICTASCYMIPVTATTSVMDIIVLSIINMVTSTFVCNAILQGFSSAFKYEIITMHEEELARELVMELGRGVTKIKARGGYTGQEKTILICIIKRRHLSAFNRIIKKYPDTFAYTVATKEVYGLGFTVQNAKLENFGSALKKGKGKSDD